jgi:hypothetical protein
MKKTPKTNYKAKVLDGLKEATTEVELIKQGKLKGIPAKELFTVDEARIYSKNLIGKLASEKQAGLNCYCKPPTAHSFKRTFSSTTHKTYPR